MSDTPDPDTDEDPEAEASTDDTDAAAPTEATAAAEFACDHDGCDETFDSQQALNGHAQAHVADAPPADATVRGYLAIDRTRGRVVHIPVGAGLPQQYP